MKKLISTILSLVLSLSIAAPYAYAAKSISQLKEEMSEREAEIKKTEKEINSKKNERDARIEERNKLDLQISGLMSDIDDVESVIDEKQTEIDKKNEEIEALDVVIEENNDRLKQRMKVMYEYGSASYLELILEAKGLSDFFSRVSVVKDIVKHDREIINTYVNAKTEVEEARKVIETEQTEQIEAKNILENKKDEIEKLQNQKEAIISELNSDIKALEKQEQQAEADYNSLISELNKALGKSDSSTTYKSTGEFVWPSAASRRITSYFGKRNAPNAKATTNHRGIDIGAPSGTNVLAADSGTVVTAGYNSSYGYYVTINHGGGFVTLYAHNSRLLVSKGDKVTRGQVIAKVGSTGNSTGPHIHFEVRVNGVCQNPLNYL